MVLLEYQEECRYDENEKSDGCPEEGATPRVIFLHFLAVFLLQVAFFFRCFIVIVFNDKRPRVAAFFAAVIVSAISTENRVDLRAVASRASYHIILHLSPVYSVFL